MTFNFKRKKLWNNETDGLHNVQAGDTARTSEYKKADSSLFIGLSDKWATHLSG